MRNPVLTEQSHRRPGRMLLSSGAVLSQKTPVKILLYRSLLQARLYLISPTPRILEVIILEKCGTGPELFIDLRREQMWSDIAMLRRLKSRMGCGLGRGRAPSRGYSSIPGRKECFIQPMALQPSPDLGCYREQNELYRYSIL